MITTYSLGKSLDAHLEEYAATVAALEDPTALVEVASVKGVEADKQRTITAEEYALTYAGFAGGLKDLFKQVVRAPDDLWENGALCHQLRQYGRVPADRQKGAFITGALTKDGQPTDPKGYYWGGFFTRF